VSPLRTKYLFSRAARVRGRSFNTPEELAYELAGGKVTLVVEPVPLFDRAVSAALDTLAARQPSARSPRLTHLRLRPCAIMAGWRSSSRISGDCMNRSLTRACALLFWSLVATCARRSWAARRRRTDRDPGRREDGERRRRMDALTTQHSKVNIHTAGLMGTAERWSEFATGPLRSSTASGR
jgi:hypothetical protein